MTASAQAASSPAGMSGRVSAAAQPQAHPASGQDGGSGQQGGEGSEASRIDAAIKPGASNVVGRWNSGVAASLGGSCFR
jgi:hypothetical protein